MPRKNGIVLSALVLLGTLVFSCSLFARSPRANAKNKKTLPRAEQASLFYLEGIKSNVLEGDSARAKAWFKKVLEIDSTHSPSLYELASLTALDQPEEALQYSLKANAIDTTNTWYKMQLGRLLIATQRYDSALTLYDQLIRMNPNDPDNYRLKALLYDQLGQPEKALEVLEIAENRFGIIELLASHKLQLLLNTQQFDRAMAEARMLVETFPYNEDNYVVLAELYAMMNMNNLAQENYDKALSINPNSMRALASLNDFYKRQNDNVRFLETASKLFRLKEFPLETKLKFYEELFQNPSFVRNNFIQMGELVRTLAITYPEDLRTLDLYARYLIAGGSIEQALQLYKSHVNDSIPQKQIFNDIIGMEAYLKRADSVDKYTTIALERFPEDAELRLQKASVTAYMLEKPQEAIPLFEEALKYAKTDSLRSVIYGAIGDNYHTLGDDRKCFKAYDKGMKLDTTNVSIYNNYSYFLSLRNERLDKALEWAQKAVRLDPNNPTFLDTYAWVLYQLGRYEEARIPMRQAISLDSDNNKELYVHYGDILYKLGDRFMASYYWKKALENGYDAQEIENRLKQIE
ncbi:MAG TPA: tetratricopeptide repeat protein [Candidatus Alistipes pullicola]|nr:tetratricopeptide repeat protein [Candidatus Alistipes pullicola]